MAKIIAIVESIITKWALVFRNVFGQLQPLDQFEAYSRTLHFYSQR
jgi:hypothetical protein